MKVNFREIKDNSDQLDHFAKSAQLRWEWLMDEMIAQKRDIKRKIEINVHGHRYVAGIL